MSSKPKPVLRLYVRQNCHLCDDMKSELFAIKDNYGFHFEVHDIDTFEGGKDRYHDLIPVLLWGQDVICYHSLDKTLLARALGLDPKKPLPA
jgi:hypothetical protein